MSQGGNGGGPGGLFRPPQSEITHVGKSSEVDTPWQVWKRSSTVNTVQIWAATVGAVLLWQFVATVQAYRHTWPPSQWRAFLAGWASAWLFIRVAYIVPVLGTIAAWIWHGRILNHYRYVPEQKNRNFPPTYAAADVTQVGLLTVDNADELLPQVESQQSAERVIRVEVPERNGAKERRAFLPDTPEMSQFARMAANGQTFSLRTAERAKLGRDDWRLIRDAFLERGWATWRDEREKRQGLVLSGPGRAVLRYVADPSPTAE